MFHSTEGSCCSFGSVDPLRDPPMLIIQKSDSVLIKNCKAPTIAYICAAKTLCICFHRLLCRTTISMQIRCIKSLLKYATCFWNKGVAVRWATVSLWMGEVTARMYCYCATMCEMSLFWLKWCTTAVRIHYFTTASLFLTQQNVKALPPLFTSQPFFFLTPDKNKQGSLAPT